MTLPLDNPNVESESYCLSPVSQNNDAQKASDIVVLKFGSSVLSTTEAVHTAVHEIYQYIRLGKRIVVVVSAIGGETDALIGEAESVSETTRSRHLACLLATGEMRAASLLAMAVERVGLLADVLNPLDVNLQISGEHLDSEPVSIDTHKIKTALETGSVVIIPGFFGQRDDGKIGLLGRGGSDLTALFLASELNAKTCKLVKDVDGIYDQDPNKTAVEVNKYSHISWADARLVSNELVQPKAIDLAQKFAVDFKVGSIGGAGSTEVGAFNSLKGLQEKAKKYTVALVGHGAVGGGVYKHLVALGDDVEVVSIAVSNIEKHIKAGVPEALLTTDLSTIVDKNPDIIFESLSVCDPAVSLINAALKADIHVISANKQAIAKLLDTELGRKATLSGQLRYSAAAAGGIPVLETVNFLKAANGPKGELVEVTGVLNGTTNFVLDRLALGVELSLAVKEAQDLGYAEADPTADIDGPDAEAKLKLIAFEAWGTAPKDTEITCHPLSSLKKPENEGDGIRQVARLKRDSDTVTGTVGPEVLEAGHFLLGAVLAGNRVILTYENGEQVCLDGQGAGRWPTSAAMMGDYFALAE